MPADSSEIDFGATIRAYSPGQRVFSRFTLVRILGRGGMGVVWLTQDDKLDREVALKFLPEAVALDPRAVDDLKRETRRSLELTHPNIVRIYDFFEDDSAAAISMEYVAGGTLAKLAVDQPKRCYEPEQILPWIEQLVDGLEYAHETAQIVHRDLKPANLMVDEKRNLKITDFGISATVTDSVTRVSRLASSGATPAYASPQQVMGERPSPLDDIYSLGSSIFDLVTGRPPFHTGNLLVQVQSKIAPTMTERRRELGVTGKKIPDHWEQTVAACLAKDPAARPRSARAVLEGLEGKGLKLGEEAGGVAVIPANQSGPVTADPPANGGASNGGSWTPPPPPPQTPEKPKHLGHVFGALWAMLAGRRGLVPQLISILVPLALIAWVLIHFMSGEGSDARGTPVVKYVPNEPAPAPVQPSANPANPPQNDRGQNVSPWAGNGLTPENRPGNDRSSNANPPATNFESPAPSTTTSVQRPANASSNTNDAPTPRPVPAQPEAQPYVAPPPAPYVAPTAAPIATGTVRITSEPSGATVSWHGRELGKTPLALDVQPGPVEYLLTLYGYEDMRVSAEARAQRTMEISAPLRAVQQTKRSNRDILVPDLQLTLISLEPGEFMMGAPASETGPDSDEQPQTRVTLTRQFWIGQTEVTQAQWQAVTGRGSSANPRSPVVRVSWDEVSRFCQQLTERERSAGRLPSGYRYCLPTEAQWEYACRAGTTGPYAGDVNALAYAGHKGGAPRPVAQGQPNAWGFYDMHGNVSEWTDSWYEDYPGGAVTDYAGAASGSSRVFRGGAFDATTRSIRSAYRGYVSGSTGASNRGFRVALAPAQ